MIREILESIKSYTYDNTDAVHNEYKDYKSILRDVKKGKKLHWGSKAYDLVLDGEDKIGVLCNINGSYILLGDTEYDISRVFKS